MCVLFGQMKTFCRKNENLSMNKFFEQKVTTTQVLMLLT